jgi:hypothetical protein
MIHATIRMTMPGKKIREAVDILGSVAERTRIQPGCIRCRIYHDEQEENVIMLDVSGPANTATCCWWSRWPERNRRSSSVSFRPRRVSRL